MIKKIFRKISKGVKRKGRLAWMKYITFSQKYKPVGIRGLRQRHLDIEVLEINPSYTSKLDLTPQFLEDCSPYIKPVTAIQYPSDYVATIKDGRIFAYDINNYAVISNDNYLIDEASFQWVDSMVEAKDNMVFSVKGFTKPKKYAGRVFSLLTLGAAKHYYYHWVFDAVAKLHLLKKSGLFDKVDYFLVPNYQYQYNKDYLKHFGISESKIINEEIEHHIQADLLMVCSEIRIEDHLPKDICNFFYSSFVNSYEKKRSGKAIYIARGDAAKSRKVSNEAALIPVLKNLGFEIYYLSRISVQEQAAIFNSASLIVAAHGGGLSNLVFCEPGTKVLEFFPDQYVRHYFYDICTKRGLIYDYLLCESERAVDNHFDGESVGLTADIEGIQKKINTLLGRQEVNTYSPSSLLISAATESVVLETSPNIDEFLKSANK